MDLKTNQKIWALFDRQDGFNEQASVYLSNRSLSLPMAFKCGIRAIENDLYFPFMKNGEIVRWKCRSMIEKKNTYFNKISEEEKKSFKMPFFNQINWPDKDFLIVTEGEFDCIALMQLIERNVVSLPNGAQSLEKTFKDQYNYLQDYEIIYICTDNDECGNLASKKAMSMLSPKKYRRLLLPTKDANEWIQKESFLDKVDLEYYMLNSKRIETESFTNIQNLNDIFDKIDLGTKTGFKNLDNVLGGLRRGEVTVVTADTGAGKSTFCTNLMYKLACKNEGVWINSYEMNYKIIARKFASFVLNKSMKFEKFTENEKITFKNWCENKNLFINKSVAKIDLISLRKQFEIATYAYDVKFILLDHLDYIHSAGKKETTYENIDDAVREIHSLAMEFNVSVILVAHPKQVNDGKEISMNDLKGSSSIKQFADNILILTRTDRIDPKDTNRLKIKVCKNRLFGVERTIYLNYLQNSDSYTD